MFEDDGTREIMLARADMVPVRVRSLPTITGDDMVPVEIEVDGVVVAWDTLEPEAWEVVRLSPAFREERQVVFIARRRGDEVYGQLGIKLLPGDELEDDTEDFAAYDEEDSDKTVVVIAHSVMPLEDGADLRATALEMFGYAMMGQGTNPELRAVEDLLDSIGSP